MSAKYQIFLLDKDGCTIGAEREADNLTQAKQWMSHLLSDEFARMAETTHQALNTEKAEVRTAAGECVLDAFYEAAAAPDHPNIRKLG